MAAQQVSSAPMDFSFALESMVNAGEAHCFEKVHYQAVVHCESARWWRFALTLPRIHTCIKHWCGNLSLTIPTFPEDLNYGGNLFLVLPGNDTFSWDPSWTRPYFCMCHEVDDCRVSNENTQQKNSPLCPTCKPWICQGFTASSIGKVHPNGHMHPSCYHRERTQEQPTKAGHVQNTTTHPFCMLTRCPCIQEWSACRCEPCSQAFLAREGASPAPRNCSSKTEGPGGIKDKGTIRTFQTLLDPGRTSPSASRSLRRLPFYD